MSSSFCKVRSVELTRTEGWEARLTELFEKERAAAFDWDEHNCVTFAGCAVMALTGARSLGYPVCPYAQTALAAARALDELGGLEAAASRVLGTPSGDWRRLRRGDIALVELDGRALLTVCTGRTLCAPGPQGLEHLPLKAALKVWSVG